MIDVTKIADCANCPFSKNGAPPHKPVLGEFPSVEPIAVLVGESPGENEVREGRPFVGSTGQELDRQLARASIPRHKCVTINATACRPPAGKTDNMLGRAAKCCKPLFEHSLADRRNLPKLAMGKWAAWAVTGKASGVEHTRGFLRDNKTIITFHPTYAFFKNPWVKGDFEIDLQRFRRLIDGTLQDDPKVITAPTMADINDLLQAIQENSRRVAVDIETGAAVGDYNGHTGKDPTRATLKTIAFGTDTLALAFQWPIVNGEWNAIHKILVDHTICKVFHNGWFFDLRVLRRYGVKVVNVLDTREIRRALVSTSPLALRYLAQTYVDFSPWKELEDEK